MFKQTKSEVFRSDEMIWYRTKITSEFFDNGDTSIVITSFVSKLRERMRRLRYTYSTSHKRTPFIHKELDTCTYVFLQDNTVRKLLQQPYKSRLR